MLIAPKDSTAALKITPGFALAEELGEEKLAMANTDAVPAGVYGKAALTSLGVWDKVKDKVAQAENVRAALLLVSPPKRHSGSSTRPMPRPMPR